MTMTDMLAANLANEPWLSMGALADHLTEIGRPLEADGFRFLIKGKHIPSMIMDIQGKEAWYWRSYQDGMRNTPHIGSAYGDFLPTLVFQSNRISKVSKTQMQIVVRGDTYDQKPHREALYFKSMLDAWAQAVWAWGDLQTTMQSLLKGQRDSG